jgi:hypothetical protein
MDKSINKCYYCNKYNDDTTYIKIKNRKKYNCHKSCWLEYNKNHLRELLWAELGVIIMFIFMAIPEMNNGHMILISPIFVYLKKRFSLIGWNLSQ